MSANPMSSRLDPDQSKAVELRRNGAVSAGAGSGKTTVLAARYLDLVLRDGADVRSILVLTFTRKAAAEMYGRIHRELLASGEPRALEQVDRFSEAQISTLDSFCSLVLRPEAQEYGYPPDFRVDDEECGRIARAQALSFLLERREDPALREVFARLGFERAWKELFADAAARLWTPSAAPDIPAMLRLQADTAERTIRDQAALIQEAARAAGEAGSGSPSAKAASVLDAFATLPAGFEDLPTDMIAAALELVVFFNLQGFGRSDAETRIKEAASAARDAARRILKAREMEKLAPLTGSVLDLLAELGERVRRAKRGARVMGFRDVAEAAVDLLSRRPGVRAGWKRRFRYIMIDEFQDDDELQKDLLYLLAERPDRTDPGVPEVRDLDPDKLFFVGDEKQSIYRFRGADVSVFRGLAEDLGAEGPALRTNYRSEPELVSFFNETFERVLGDAVEPWEARFAPILSRPAAPGGSPSIRYLLKPRRPAAEREGYRSDDEALACEVASFVRKSVEGGELRVPDPGAPGGPGWRSARYDDFAVLLRSTGKQYLLEKYFRLLKVPYSAGDVCGLFTESPANDVYQALRLAVHPEDGPAYAAFLRSPFVRISDDAFVRILAPGLPPFDPEARCAADLSEDDGARFDRGREILDRLRAGADRLPHSTLVRSLWYEEGLRLGLVRKPDAHPFLEHFDYLFRLAADADARGLALASFVAELEPLTGTPERVPDLDAPREAGSGLRILTVHRSKGLEFPVVILPFLDNAVKPGGNGKAWYLSRNHGITLNLKPWDDPQAKTVNLFYDLAREEESRQEAAELKRLFYVACTRASAHLVFASVEPVRADKQGASFHTLLAGGDGLRDPGTGFFPHMPARVREIPVPDLGEEDYGKLFAGGRGASLETLAPRYEEARIVRRDWEPRTVSATAVKAAWEVAGKEAWEDLPSLYFDTVAGEVPETVFGELCHAAIQARLDPSGAGTEDFEALLSGMPEAHRDALAGEARRLAEGFLGSELGRAAAEAAAAGTLRAEAPFLYAPEADAGTDRVADVPVVSGRMDLCFRTGNRVEVVDFKSDRRRRDGVYDGQLAVYRAACRGLYPGAEVRTRLFWLRAARAEERVPAPGEEVRLSGAALRAAAPDAGDPPEAPADR